MTSLAALTRPGRRTLSPRNRAGAWLAMLTCPCHGALVLYLLAGTAFGSLLFAYRGWMYAGLAVAFVAGLWLMFRRDSHLRCVRFRVPRTRFHVGFRMPDSFWVPSRDSEISTDSSLPPPDGNRRPHGETDPGTWNPEPGTVPNQVSTGVRPLASSE